MTPFAQTASDAAPTERRDMIERRGCRRFAIRLRIEAWQSRGIVGSDFSAQVPGPATILDISLSGVRFCCVRPFPIGAEVWMRARLGCRTHYVKGKVRRMQARQDAGRQGYEYGIQFLRCPQSARFTAALAALTNGGSVLDGPA